MEEKKFEIIFTAVDSVENLGDNGHGLEVVLKFKSAEDAVENLLDCLRQIKEVSKRPPMPPPGPPEWIRKGF